MAHHDFDHLHAPRVRWWLVIGTGLLTLGCGTIGFWQLGSHGTEHEPDVASQLSGALYSAVQLLVLHTPHLERSNAWIEIGRWAGAFTLVTGTVLLLGQRFRHELLLFFHGFSRGHLVVCGLGDRGFDLAVRAVKESGRRAVVIDPEPDLQRMLECESLGILVLRLDATKAGVLRKARVHAAGDIVVVTENDETNVQIALGIRALEASDGPFAGRCRVHLADINLREALQRATPTGGSPTGMTVEYFDMFAEEARRVLLKLVAGSGGGKQPEPGGVCLVILGFGRMGRSLVLQAVQLEEYTGAKPFRVIVIDRAGDAQQDRFLFRHPELAALLEFQTAEAESATARNRLASLAQEKGTRLHVFVCVDENTRATEISLHLRELLAGRPRCTLAVRIKSGESLAAILAEQTGEGGAGPRIEAFGFG